MNKKYAYQTTPSHVGYYAYGITKTRHSYPARSRLGARTVWKESSSVELGKFDTRLEAQIAGRTWVRDKQPPKPPRPAKPTSRFEVIVGNIGTVYDGPSLLDARKAYSEYRNQSRTNYGRAAGEPVILFQDGEPKWEHEGTLTSEEAS